LIEKNYLGDGELGWKEERAVKQRLKE